MDIRGDRADFVSGEEVVSFFIGLFLAFWPFGEGGRRPQLLKKPSQKVKRASQLDEGITFLNERLLARM